MSDRTAILVHGYNVTNPMSTVGKLREPFEQLGYAVETFTYGYVPHTWQITKRNPSLAKKLAARVRYHRSLGRRVDVVGHSNGCTIMHLAARELGAGMINTAVAINPALERDLHPCSAAALVQVWHNEGDVAVKASRWLRLLSWLTPMDERLARPWGQMGAYGYRGDSKSVVNFDTQKDFAGVVASGHSAVFAKPESNFYLQRIAQFCAVGRLRP